MDGMSPYGNSYGQKSDGDRSPLKQAWKEKHPNRYTLPARNNNVNRNLAKLIKGLTKGTEWSPIEDACPSSHYKLKACKGIPEGICPSYALGYCTFKGCTVRHCYNTETPQA